MKLNRQQLISVFFTLAVSVLLFKPVILLSQLQFVRADSIQVTASGFPLKMAWAGGFNSPQFSEIDLDGDGIKDLFVLERNFNGIVKTFLNNGTEGVVDYTHDPFYQSAFPQMRNWALLADYNCDGKEDLFTSVPFGIAVYQNVFSGSTGLKFNKVTSLLKTSTPEGEDILYVSPPDIPSITDIDNDGDLDILAFDVLGKYVEYHKNQSIENNGNCDDLVFELKNRCWGYFSENETNNGINLFDTCAENVPDPEKGRHAGSTLLALDLTGNKVKDLVIGDIAHDNLVELINGGTGNSSSMVSYDSTFPSNSVAVDLTTYPAAFYLDVDNDNLKDLVVSPNNPNTSVNTHSAWYYKNTGTQDVPSFSFQEDDFLQSQMIDVGEGARPVFFDYDGDGLQDIVIGNYGYFIEAGTFQSKLALYRNSGSLAMPSYDFVEDDYMGLSSFEFKGIYPAFGDIDADGDFDMLTGDEDGNIHLFTNTADEGEAANFILSSPNYKGIDVGQTAMPQIVDVNRDELPDLLIGERSGTIQYFQNTGTPADADFSSSPTNDLFGGIDVMADCCTGYAAPYMSKDSLANSIMYVGSERGVLYLFNNIDDNLDGEFSIVDSLFLHGLNVNVSGSDLDSDGKEELVYGEYAGGIAILTSGKPSFINVAERFAEQLDVTAFPNPASDQLHVLINNPSEKTTCTVRFANAYGQLLQVKEIVESENIIQLDIAGYPKGIYLLSLRSENGKNALKKIVIR